MKRSQAKPSVVTIERLATMVQKGFSGLREEFVGEIDRRFGVAEKTADSRHNLVLNEIRLIRDDVRDLLTHTYS